jgi:hypothetical protein
VTGVEGGGYWCVSNQGNITRFFMQLILYFDVVVVIVVVVHCQFSTFSIGEKLVWHHRIKY